MTAKRVIALILVVLLLGAGAFYLRQVEHNDRDNMRDLYSEVEPMQRQREALAAERDGLELDYALQMRDVGTIQLLIEEADESVYTEIYPLMRDRGIVGVLGVNTKELPGLINKMTTGSLPCFRKVSGVCWMVQPNFQLYEPARPVRSVGDLFPRGHI